MRYILIVWMLNGQELHLPKANEAVCLRDKMAVMSGPARVEDAECIPTDMTDIINTLKRAAEKRAGEEI